MATMIGASVENLLRLEHHAQQMQLKSQSPSSSSRILDIPCKVCGDYSSGKHYNIFACDGCAGFFKRSIRRNRQYICKGKEEGSCIIDKAHRNQCRACRLQKCQDTGMNKDAVQHERGPRNSTLRRAMSSFFEQHKYAASVLSNSPQSSPAPLLSPGGSGVLNLALPKHQTPQATRLETPLFSNMPIMPAATYLYNNIMVPRIPPAPLPTLHHFQSPSSMSPPVTPPPNLMSPEAICESAARLLFVNIQWAKNLITFTSLPLQDQLLLLEEAWKELFIIGAAQYIPLTDLSALIATSDAAKTNGTTFLKKVQDFQEILSQAKQYQMDETEYYCLRLVSLFKTSFVDSTKNLLQESRIQDIQNDTQINLSRYLGTVRPHEPLRFGKILLLHSSIRNVSSDVIEELFFRKTIGNIPIVKIICDMYRKHQN